MNELYWAAGFFDGEGFAGFIRSGKSQSLVFTISQAHPQVLERFRLAVNGGSRLHLRGPYSRHRGKGIYNLVAQGTEAARILKLLLPLVSDLKRAQIETALSKYVAYVPPKYNGMTCLKGHPWAEETTRIRKDGHRQCKICARTTAKAWYAKKTKGDE